MNAGGMEEEEGNCELGEGVPEEEVGSAEAIRAEGGGGRDRGNEVETDLATTVAMTAGTPLMARAPRGAEGGMGSVIGRREEETGGFLGRQC